MHETSADKLYLDTMKGEVHPFKLDPSTIHIRDIARSLAYTPRWRGHTRSFYSVAEHSLYVSRQCSPHNRMAGLLHDAAEAYLSDIPAPLKPYCWFHLDDGNGKTINRPFNDVENEILGIILQKYGQNPKISPEVFEVDLKVREWEAMLLKGDLYTHVPMGPDEAMHKWISEFEHLLAGQP